MILRLFFLALVATCVSGCGGCALDPGESKDTSYFEGCWNHLKNGSNSVFRDTQY